MELYLLLGLGFGAGGLLLGIALLSLAARRKTERAAISAEPSSSEAEVPEIVSPAVAAEPARRDLEREPEMEPVEPEAPIEIPEPEPSNRRKYRRLRSDQTFVITPFAGRAIMAECCDLSTGGMRFGVVGCTLRAGDLVRVTFNIGDETIAAIGSVLRVWELDPITSEVSLEFVRLDPWASQLLEQALEAET